MRLLLSYAFDWISLIAVAGIAAALGHIDPAKRPFSLVNPDISCVFVPPGLIVDGNSACQRPPPSPSANNYSQ